MRSKSIRYFIGSLFSRQALYAYGIAGGITTAGQLVMLWVGRISPVSQQSGLPMLIELYIETLIPLWVPPVTPLDTFIFFLNVVIALWVLLSWTISFDQSQGF